MDTKVSDRPAKTYQSTSTLQPSRKKPWEPTDATPSGTAKEIPVPRNKPNNQHKSTKKNIESYAKGENAEISVQFKKTISQFEYNKTPATKVQPRIFKKRKTLREKSPEPEIELPSVEYVAGLLKCPLCPQRWKSKSIHNKHKHLRECAISQDFTSKTVSVLVERALQALAKEHESARRNVESCRNLMDRVLRNADEIQVVRCATGIRHTEVEEYITRARRKKLPSRVERIVQLIRSREKQQLLERERRAAKHRVEEAKIAPRSTGSLQPFTETSKTRVANRALELLDKRGGSGLTQVTNTNIEDFPMPITQRFAPSRIACAENSMNFWEAQHGLDSDDSFIC